MTPVLCDSGAFSAWQRGDPIDIAAYIDFLRVHKALFANFVSLDLIAGSGGGREWRLDHLQEAAAASFSNWRKMKDAGLDAIPVFHQTESFDWLRKYIDEGADYVGLSYHRRAHKHEAISWVEDCFEILRRAQRPIRTHGFGIASALMLREFPWSSTDAGTWYRAAGMGQVPIARYKAGKPDYRLDHRVVTVGRGRHLRRHLDDLDDASVDHVRQYLRDLAGIELPEARYSLAARWRIWVKHLSAMAARSSVTLYFVSNRSKVQNKLLIDSGVPRLLTYYDFRTGPAAVLEDLIAGKSPGIKKLRKWKRADWRNESYWERRGLQLYYRSLSVDES